MIDKKDNKIRDFLFSKYEIRNDCSSLVLKIKGKLLHCNMQHALTLYRAQKMRCYQKGSLMNHEAMELQYTTTSTRIY